MIVFEEYNNILTHMFEGEYDFHGKVIALGGESSSGKSTVLWELANSLAKNKKIIYVNNGNVILKNKNIVNVKFNMDFFEYSDLSEFDLVLVDEIQQIEDKNTIKELMMLLRQKGLSLVFTTQTYKRIYEGLGDKEKQIIPNDKLMWCDEVITLYRCNSYGNCYDMKVEAKHNKNSHLIKNLENVFYFNINRKNINMKTIVEIK
jgi:ABC-type dipeptide/oligopeptide/nickel transport system ATPase component